MDYIDKELIEYDEINSENNFINKINVLLDLNPSS